MPKEQKRAILKDEEVNSSIISAMRKYGTARSQHELTKLALKGLKKINKKASLSAHRARLIALEIPGIEVRVLTKKSSKEKPSNCPACGAALKGLYAINLLNKKVLVGLKCRKCGYHGSIKKFAPLRYEFSLVKK